MEKTSTSDHHRGPRAGGVSRIARRGVLLLPLALLPGCAVVDRVRPAVTVTLTIVASGWTGWSKEQPEPETSTEEVTRGSEFVRRALGDDITFTVRSATDRELTLHTSTPMSERAWGDGINLTTDQDTFTIAAGGTLTITTPSMDGGTTFEITYEE